MMSVLYNTNTLNWVYILLAHWNKIPRVDMSLHSDSLSWFPANQSLLLHIKMATEGKQQMPVL